MDDGLRTLFASKADEMQLDPALPAPLARRVRVRRYVTVAASVAVISALVTFGASIAMTSDPNRITPAPDLPPVNDFDIYTMAVDGTNVIRVTEDPRDESQPAWSPTADRLAFVRFEPDGTSHIYVTVRGRPELALTRGRVFDETPAWSPDGTQIAFIRRTDPTNSPRIFVLDVSKKNARPKRLIRHVATSAEVWPTWSPDGRHIAFVGNDATIFRYDFADESVTPLVKSSGGFGKTSWGPDGLIATTVINEDDDVYVFEEDGTGLRRITDLPDAPDGFPAWSPDGEVLVFMTIAPNGTDEIYRIDITNGGETRALTSNGINDGFPAWSPVDDRIAFASNRYRAAP